MSDDETKFQVNDRRSFEEFVGLGVMNDIPDATTLAFFRERLRKAGVIEELFEKFESYLRSQGLEARGGQIISIVSEDSDELDNISEHVIKIPSTIDPLVPVIGAIPLQLLAYHIAVARGCNVDRPRNLAKSVTVE